jgi:hypothetical protein
VRQCSIRDVHTHSTVRYDHSCQHYGGANVVGRAAVLAAGESDKATQEWKDGVLAVAFRSLASDPSPDKKWLVLDGPVDAIW